MKNNYLWRSGAKTKMFGIVASLLMLFGMGGVTTAQTTCEIDNMQGGLAAGSLSLWATADQGLSVLFDPAGTGDQGDPGCFLEEPYVYTVEDVEFLMIDASAFGETGGMGTLEYEITISEAVIVDGCQTIGTELWSSGTLTVEMDDSGQYIISNNVNEDVTGPFFVTISTVSWSGDATLSPSIAWDDVERPNCRQYVLSYADGVLQTTDFGDFFTGGATGWAAVSVVGSYTPEGDADLAVNNVTAPASAEQGMPTVVSAEVTNNGDYNVQNATFSLLEDGTEVETGFATLASGETGTVDFTYTPTIIGDVTLTVVASIDGDIDDANDEATTTITIVEPATDCAIEGEDFEDLADGDYLGETHEDWTTWSGTVGGEEDVAFSTDQANSGSNSVLITGDATDVVMSIGNQQTGVWEYEQSMYVPEGSSAYFNMQGDPTPGTIWIFDIRMNPDGTGEVFTFDAATGEDINITEFEYPQGEWFDVRFVLDTDQDMIETYVDGEFVGQRESSEADVTYASMNFYPFGGEGETEENRTFYIDDVSMCPLDLDSPCEAYPMAEDVTYVGDNTDAGIFDESIFGDCWADASVQSDVWYSFTADEAGFYTVNTFLNILENADTQLAAYTADTCGGTLTQIGCNEDVVTTVTGLYMAYMTVEVDAGTTVYVQVDGWNGTTGTFEIKYNRAPDNDECPEAMDVNDLTVVEPGSINVSDPVTLEGATMNEIDVIPACFDDAGGAAVSNSTWFTFEGDGNSYFISTTDCDGTADPYALNTQMAVYEGSCGNLIEVACNEDMDAEGENFAAGTQIDTELGTTYYIMVDAYTVITGDFCLSFEHIVGVEENTEADYSLYPNPTSGKVNLEATDNFEGVRILNIVGAAVKTVDVEASNTISINISDLPSGVYFVEMTIDGEQHVERLIRE